MKQSITLAELAKMSEEEVLELHKAAQTMQGASPRVRRILSRNGTAKTDDAGTSWTPERQQTERIRKELGIPKLRKDRTTEQQTEYEAACRTAQDAEDKTAGS